MSGSIEFAYVLSQSDPMDDDVALLAAERRAREFFRAARVDWREVRKKVEHREGCARMAVWFAPRGSAPDVPRGPGRPMVTA